MSLRRSLYYGVKALTGSRSPAIFERRLAELQAGINSSTTDTLLVTLLRHCEASVPYYADIIRAAGGSEAYRRDPRAFLLNVPILEKATLRTRAQALRSTDLAQRKWYANSSGGSTGEPVQLVQDASYRDQVSAITLLFSYLAGKRPGDREVRLWGSERDIFENTIGWKAKLTCLVTNTGFLNAFRMTPEKMAEYVRVLNAERPALILAYAQALYELAQYAETRGLDVAPQRAIMTSAGTLHPFMRETLERVFGCRVFNRYGSREVGDIACERPGMDGLWVAPWGCYVEIVNEQGCPVPPGVEGDILVTSLANYAMPLVRYRIGDRGALMPEAPDAPGEQRLQCVTGRVSDNFRTREGRRIPGEYFIHLIGVVLNRGAIRKFQVVQHDYARITVRLAAPSASVDTEELAAKIRVVMDPDCEVAFEFVDEIEPSPSGKYRYTVSELPERP